ASRVCRASTLSAGRRWRLRLCRSTIAVAAGLYYWGRTAFEASPHRWRVDEDLMNDDGEWDDERALLHARLERLRLEHRDLDDVIERLVEHVPFDQLQLQRLKKRKLLLKDQISRIEDQLTPDIIA